MATTTHRSDDRWMASDEWMSEFLEDLASQPGRARRVRREAERMVPAAELARRAYDDESDNLLRFIHGMESVGRVA